MLRTRTRPASKASTLRIKANNKPPRNNREKPSAKPEKKPSAWRGVDWGRVRLWGVSIAFASLWILLWGQAFRVQIIRGPQYAEQARRNQQATEVITGRRGVISDRHGHALARSVESRSVSVRPKEIKDAQEVTAFLSKTLDLPPAKVKALVTSNRSYVWVARKINSRLADAVKAGAMPGVYLTTEFERVYPYQHLAGQLLGFVSVDGEGIEGLERSLDKQLAGQNTSQVLRRDATGRRMYSGNEDLEDPSGDDITLTIDTQVQFAAEAALAKTAEQFGARWGGCMVVDVPTGDVLAWAEFPFFNPNKPAESTPFIWRNKMAMDALEQGSTIKPFLVAAALQEKVVQRDTKFNCEKGKWEFKGATIRDTHGYDTLPVNKIIRVSSNIGAAKIGLKLGATTYHQYLTRLGFGGRTGLPLAGESRGILRSPKQWAEIDLATASFGQSFSATAVQMAQAYLCIANDGVRKPLRLIVDPEPKEVEEERLFSSEVASQVRDMMREVIEDEGGTGAQARIAGLTVGGKTGTAQKASGDSYGSGRVASFVGLVPVEKPRYLVVVILDEPTKNQYGGIVAAPVFQQVALRTMSYHGLLPEVPPVTTASAKGAAAKAAAKNDAKANAKGGKKGVVAVAAKGPKDQGVSGGPEVRGDVPDEATAPREATGTGVPSVVGLSVRRAVETLFQRGMTPVVKGSGNVVVRQSPAPGSPLPQDPAAACTLWLGEQS